MTEPDFRLVLTPPARRGPDRLPAAAAAAVAEFLVGPLLSGPTKVGRQLRRELAGLWSARRGPYRVGYEIDDASHEVRVLRVDHRADVYRPRD